MTPLQCQGCGQVEKRLLWSYDTPPACETCGGTQVRVAPDDVGRSAAVVDDTIDVTHEHGLCHPDGTPRRFDSRGALRAAERAAGLRVLERGERFRGDEASKARAQARGY